MAGAGPGERSAEALRLGIVGCGWISERHARAAAASPEVAIVACCDVRLDAAESWAERYGCERAYGDFRSLVAEHELDGVLLATWPNLHREQVLGCLEAGVRNILCEKALAVSGAEALEMWTAAEEARALVVEGLMYRHHPAIRRMDELLAAGEVGEIDNVSAAFSLFDPAEASPADSSRDWRQRADLAGGVPYDLACYCVDACNRFAGGLPRRATAFADESPLYGTVDRLYGLVEYESGIVGHVESSKRTDFNHELTVSGPHGRVHLQGAWRIDGETEVVLRRGVGWEEIETTGFPIAPADAFRLQLESFAAAVRGESPPSPSLAESVVGAYTLEALLASSLERAHVDVEIPDRVRADLAGPPAAAPAP